MKKLVQQIQMAILKRIKLRCPSCGFRFWVNRWGLKKTKEFDGPFCPKCATKLKKEVLIR